MRTIRPINTRYRGFHFRSRLEARWAVFFDQLELSWEYEPEGFDMDGLRYLPDFRVKTPQGSDIWYEVKPPGKDSDVKFDAFREALEEDNARTELLAGDPLDVFLRSEMCPRCGVIHRAKDHLRWLAPWNGDETEVICYPCDLETPSGGGHPEEPGFLGVPVTPHKGSVLVSLSAWRKIENQQILPAARHARAARFEFGAKP